MPMRVLLAPITISPTKPLTPSHLKFLLSMDVLRRATGAIAHVDCVYNHRAWAVTQQTMGFWAYLDRELPGADFSAMSEEAIGALYVRSHEGDRALDPEALNDYAARVEGGGWLHPVSQRVLDLWEEHYRVLGLVDVAMGRSGPESLPAEQVLEGLAAKGLCLDARRFGGAVYLDLTARGLPLRMVVSPSGQANYIMCLLRELIPLAPRYDLVVLAYDRELRPDYLMVEHILRAHGANVARLEVVRVPIDGVVKSGRYGGWAGYTVPDLRRYVADAADAPFQLGLRLYLIAALGRGGHESIHAGGLRRWVRRAERLIDTSRSASDSCPAFLERLAAARGYVDPYVWMSLLLRRRGGVPLPEGLGVLGFAGGAA